MSHESDKKALHTKEYRILKAMKLTLTHIIKDTATPPGLKHPLTDNTIEDIRQCLGLITAREMELLEAAGEKPGMRPRFIDEPETSVAVPLSEVKKKKGGDKGEAGG